MRHRPLSLRIREPRVVHLWVVFDEQNATTWAHSSLSCRRIKLQISKLAARRGTRPALISSKRGVQLDTILERANGSRETLIDAPYDYINQITYETDMVMKPGNYLVTTCHFQNDTERLFSRRVAH